MNYSSAYYESLHKNAQQLKRLDRVARTKAKCKVGKPCGNVCIPRNAECKGQDDTTELSKNKGWSNSQKMQLAQGVAGIAVGSVVAGGILSKASRSAKKNAQYERERVQWENIRTEFRKRDKRNAENHKKNLEDLEREAQKRQKERDARERASENYKKYYEEVNQKQKTENTKTKEHDKESGKTRGGQDWWKVLGVEKNADPDTIKKAYHEAALKYHPDIDKSPEAVEKMQNINEAYEIAKKKKHGDAIESIDLISLTEIDFAYREAQKNYPKIDKNFWYCPNNLEFQYNWQKPLF